MHLLKRIASVAFALVVCVPSRDSSAQDTIRIPAKPPVWGTSVELTPVFSIGAVDGPDEYAFGRVEFVAVATNGMMYVFDEQDGQIRSYDPSGKFLRNIGRKGAGPGEYRWIAGMDVTADSVLVTMDISNARVTYFAPSGKVIRSFNDARISSTGGHDMVVDKSGLVNMEIRPGEGEMPLAPGVPAAQGKHILRFNQAGKLVDALVMPRAMATPRTFFLQSPDGGNTNFQARSASASLRIGGYVFGNGDVLRLIIHTATGPTRVVERTLPTLKVGPEERTNWQEWATHFERQNLGKINIKYTIPATKPAWRDLITDNDSRIWVSLYAPAQKITLPPRPATKTGPRLYWQQPATYDVFSATGEYLGRVVLPMRSKVVAAAGNRLWVLAKGEDDEDIIRLFTISGAK